MKEIDIQFLQLPIAYQRMVIEQFKEKCIKWYGIKPESLQEMYDKAERCIGCNNKKQCVCKYGIIKEGIEL
jgi:hypothetical protein